ncbi:MAG: glutamate formimidoyltransferase [Acidimicrobiales bacterium]
MLECVVNISEGSRTDVVGRIGEAAGGCLLDTHHDAHHNRSVLTLAGPDIAVHEAVRAVVRTSVAALNLSSHVGVHPRIGVVDVVPWIDLGHIDAPWTPASLAARDLTGEWMADALAVPCFAYGPERTLPTVRSQAWTTLAPDWGPPAPHPTAGATALGARGALVAFNVWLGGDDLTIARSVATEIRRPGLRTLGLLVGGRVQVSCNLTAPSLLGPAAAFDLVVARATAAGAAVEGAELVGLIPDSVLRSVATGRWAELDLSAERTIEARLASTG